LRGFQIKTLPIRLPLGLILIFLLGFPITGAAQPWAQDYDRPGKSALARPGGFEKYSGPGQFDYFSLSPGYSVYLSSSEATLAFTGGDQPPEIVRIRFAGAHRLTQPDAEDPLPGVTHYYTGDDPKLWRTDVHRFRRIRYPDLYPGVAVLFYLERDGNGRRQLEFDFDAAPGADPSAISMQIVGATAHEANGDVELVTPSGRVAFLKKPEMYQVRENRRVPVSGSYVERAGNQFGFTVGNYNKNLPLTIDPALAYSTLIYDLMELTLFPAQFPPGTQLSERDTVNGMVADRTGNLYITGGGFVSDPSQGFLPGNPPTAVSNLLVLESFVIKLDPTGSKLLYTAYLGGNPSGITSSEGKAITLDAAGNAYVAGETNSPSFVTTPGAFNRAPACTVEVISNVNCHVPFIAKFDATGHLVFSTYTAQSQTNDIAGPAPGFMSIAVDSAGAVYVGGFIVPVQRVIPKDPSPAMIAGLITTAGAFQPTRTSNVTSYVLKLHPDGSALDYSTYLGGSSSDFVIGAAVDSNGVAQVVGESHSTDFPTTADGFQTTNTGVSAFYAKLKPDGSGLVYSTFLGAAGINSDADFIALDGSNNAYLTGFTSGPGFPTTPGAFKTNVTGTAGFNFVTEFDPLGKLVFSTYIGEAADTTGIAVDATGIYAAGLTSSSNYPLLNSIQPASTSAAAFVTKLDPTGSSLIYSTLAGTPAVSMGIDGQQNVYLAGQTGGAVSPTTIGAFETLPVSVNPFFPEGFALKIVPSLGAAVPVLTPRIISFPDILQQGVPSVPITVLVSDYGDVDLSLATITISGPNATDFSQTNNCSATITAGNNCAATVVFTPTVGDGVRTATLIVSFGGNFPAQTVSLTGRAGTPRLQMNPAPVDFGTISILDGVQQFFTMTNTGTGPLVFTGVSFNPPATDTTPFALGVPPFLETLQAGQTGLQFSIEMRSFGQAGPKSAQFIVQDNAPGSPHVFNLTGFTFAVAPDFGMSTRNGVPATATVTAGQTANYDVFAGSFLFFNAGGSISFSCSGAPAGATCSANPNSVTLPVTTAHIVVSVTTTAARASLRHNLPAWPWAAAGLAAILWMRPRWRNLRSRLLLVCAAGILATMVACGGGSNGGGGGGGIPTPPGTYNLTLTATSANVTHTLPLTLVVK
jgi:beta-propeller repeat-containing protein